MKSTRTNERPQGGKVPSGPWRRLLPGLSLILLALAAFYPALHAGFIWDDDAYVTKNEMLTAPDGLRQIWFSAHTESQYFPLVYTTLRLERALWGLNPLGYHLVNILLHGLNAWLVWALLRKLQVPGAWLAAAVFAVHPVQVETVAWVTELKNTESTFFYLLAVLTWFRFLERDNDRRWTFYVLALLFHALALFAKTTACTLPAVLLLVLWLKKEAIDSKRIIQIVPFVLSGVAMGLLTIWWEIHLTNYVAESVTDFGWMKRLLIASRALWFYAGKVAWPAGLAFSYPKWKIDVHEAGQYAWLALCLVAAGLLWWKRKAVGRGALAGMVFFVAVLSPMLGFIWLYTFRYSYVADHYQYLACLGIIAPVCAGLALLLKRWGQWSRPVGNLVCLSLLALLAGLTWNQSRAYKDLETLWRATVANNPTSFLAHNNLGNILLRRGEADEAIVHYRKALEADPDYFNAHNNLAVALAGKGQIDEALVHYRKAVDLNPANAALRVVLGSALIKAGRGGEAVHQFEKALELDPASAAACNNLAWVLATSPEASVRDGAKAVEYGLRAVKLSGGNNSVAIGTLAAAYAEAGRFPEAVESARRALQLATDAEQIKTLQSGVELYEAGRAFHMPAPSNLP